MHVAAAIVLAYFLGTIPTAVIVTRVATRGQVDIRHAGSGNPGALNTLGVLGAKAGALVLLVDTGKAVLACVIARQVSATAADFAGSAAVIGHCFPIWSKFRGGGKGVACCGGQCLATFPVYTPVAMFVAIFTSRSKLAARSFIAGLLAGGAWVTAAAIWVGFSLKNVWGPRPTAALVLSAIVSSAVMISRFEAARRAEPVTTS